MAGGWRISKTHGPTGLHPSLHHCLCEWAAQPCRSLQHFKWCLQYQHPLTSSSRRHRANGLREKTCYINTLLTFGPVEDERESLSQGPHSRGSVFCKHSVSSLHPLQSLTIFRVQFWYNTWNNFQPLLTWCCQVFISYLALGLPVLSDQSTAGNHYFFKQSSPSLSVCEQKHAAIFLELLRRASPSSFFSDRKVKVRTAVISLCLDIFRFIIIMFPQENPCVS